MSEIRELKVLKRRLDDLVEPETGLIVDNTNVSNPPTDAELDAIFGTPATNYPGFMAIVDDAGANTTVWLVVTNGTSWWYEGLTKAV